MRLRLAGLALAVMVSGCAATHTISDRDDFMAEATRSFPIADRERIIRAAEAVLKQSDPGDWEFRYTSDGFVGLRRYFVYAVIASASGREKWEFHTEAPAGSKTVTASLSISEAGVTHGGNSVQAYEGAMKTFALYRLFWARVDYVLGRSPTWVTCQEAEAELQAKNQSTLALGGLCGPTSGGRDAAPPSQVLAGARS